MEFALVDLTEAQFDAEAGSGRGRIERLGGGKLLLRRNDATDDHRHDQITRSAGFRAVLRPQ
jgi:hypothetical protein